jgi:uncharacterized protein
VNALEKRSWSPYAVGAGIGALSWFTFLSARKPLGITTPFEGTAAMLAQKTAPRASGANRYLVEREEVPRLDWEWMLAAGVGLGSALSALASGDWQRKGRPKRSRASGRDRNRRYAAAFIGGALMMFGARVAKGCTSGHSISGMMQLAASSWLFSPIMAATAVAVTRALHGKEARHAR